MVHEVQKEGNTENVSKFSCFESSTLPAKTKLTVTILTSAKRGEKADIFTKNGLSNKPFDGFFELK